MVTYVVGDITPADKEFITGSGNHTIDFGDEIGIADSYTPTPAFPAEWPWDPDSGLLITTSDTQKVWTGTLTRVIGTQTGTSNSFTVAVWNQVLFIGPVLGNISGGSPGTDYRENHVGETISIDIGARFQGAQAVFTNSVLPGGLTYNSTTKILSGTFNAIESKLGIYFYAVGGGPQADVRTDTYDWHVLAGVIAYPQLIAPLASPIALNRGAVATTIQGGNQWSGATSYSESGTRPTGMSFSTSTGALSGTPSTNGTFAYAINGVNNSGSQTSPGPLVNYVVTSAAPTLTGTIPDISGSVGDVIDVDASGAFTGAVFFTDDAPNLLPGGLRVDRATGHIVGTLSSAGAVNAQIKANNGTGSVNSNIFRVSVLARTVVGTYPNWHLFSIS